MSKPTINALLFLTVTDEHVQQLNELGGVVHSTPGTELSMLLDIVLSRQPKGTPPGTYVRLTDGEWVTESCFLRMATELETGVPQFGFVYDPAKLAKKLGRQL